MISADVKANIKQQEIKDLVDISYKFLTTNYLTHKKYFQNLKCNVKSVCIFHLFLLGIPCILILSTSNRGEGCLGLIYGQNLLILTKVICRQSLFIVYSV